MPWKFSALQGFQTFMPHPQGAYDKMLPMQKLIVFILDLKPGHFEWKHYIYKEDQETWFFFLNARLTQNKANHGAR